MVDEAAGTRGADGGAVVDGGLARRAGEAHGLRGAGGVFGHRAPAKRGITRDYTPFLLILQGMALQLQGISLPPF